jgi:mono/diheme cytochrome c family protein
MTRFDPIYRFLAALGYPHPLHPPFTHVTIGLVVAAFIFGLGGLLRRRPLLAASARHCLVLAWFFFFPTVLLGFLDWQHFYRGDWMFPIIAKLFLAALLFIVLSLGLALLYKGQAESRVLPVIYALGFLAVTALGYFGGEIVFGGGVKVTPEAAQTAIFRAGKQVFLEDCQACHRGGGNVVLPQYALKGSDELAEFKTFLAFIRNPRLDNGSKGPMPAFGPEQLPEPQARELYHYLLRAFGPPPAGGEHHHEP